uniref:Uncharacterized protein n=1 Tax=Rhizophora mucronata TaxID=61149 RepID=A0A2P2JZK7_RHIMU
MARMRKRLPKVSIVSSLRVGLGGQTMRANKSNEKTRIRNYNNPFSLSLVLYALTEQNSETGPVQSNKVFISVAHFSLQF